MTIRHDSTQCLPSQLYTAAQTRELDRLAIEEYGIPGFELMSRAGQAVFALIRSRYPAAKSLAVFCGAGNNGGDGFVVAGLALLSGWKVEVISASEGSPAGSLARSSSNSMCSVSKSARTWPAVAGFSASNAALFQT